MDKWESLKEYLKDRIKNSKDECTEYDLEQVLWKMEELEKTE